MAIMIGVSPKGIKDIVFVANNHEEGKELVELYNNIDPEVRAFEDLINEKLNPEGSTFQSDK